MPDGAIDPKAVETLKGMKALMLRSCWKVDGVGNDADERLDVKPLAELLETTFPARENVELLPQP